LEIWTDLQHTQRKKGRGLKIDVYKKETRGRKFQRAIAERGTTSKALGRTDAGGEKKKSKRKIIKTRQKEKLVFSIRDKPEKNDRAR